MDWDEAEEWAYQDRNGCYECQCCEYCIDNGEIVDEDSMRCEDCDYFAPTQEKIESYGEHLQMLADERAEMEICERLGK